MIKMLSLMGLPLLVACNGVSMAQDEPLEPRQTCPTIRPEMCTMDYRPVCAFLEKGGRQEFSNGCTACANPRVTGYTEGSCPK